jgi:acyl dehydratase
MLSILCPVSIVRSPHVQVHGLFVASMFGGILGSQFPGSIYMLQNLLFKAPCFVGASVTARLEV